MSPALATTGPVGAVQKRTYTADSGATLAAGAGVIKGLLDSSVANPTGAGQRCEGVVEYLPFEAATAVPVVRKGEVDALAGSGGVNRGDYVKMDASGNFTTSTTTGDEVAGRAVSSAASSGDHFILDLDPFIL